MSGSVTNDGCPVDVYAALPTFGEPDWIHSVLTPGGSILDLGCGVGRIADPLAQLGHRVVAVDDSEEMLAHVGSAEPVHSRIETLNLAERFDGVLLASRLVNTPDDELRAELLRVTGRHLKRDGLALIEWHPPAWFDQLTIGRYPSADLGAVSTSLIVERFDNELLSAQVEYSMGDETWTQFFIARRLSHADLERELSNAGMQQVELNEPRRDWTGARLR